MSRERPARRLHAGAVRDEPRRGEPRRRRSRSRRRARSRRHRLPSRPQGRGQGRRPAALPPVSTGARTVGIVSPGAMGSAVGAALTRGGARVVVTLAGRSERTHRLAERAGIDVLPDLESVRTRGGRRSLRSRRPRRPRAIAADIGSARAQAAAQPLVADLNADRARDRPRDRGRALARAGSTSSTGRSPARRRGSPGRRASTSRARERTRSLTFRSTASSESSSATRSAAASAVKMSTASVYKGTSALLAQALLAAQANGVLEHVLDDLRAGSPELVANVERRLASAASKSGRYVGEMREIAATQEAAGLTPALFEAMAEVFGSLSASELARSAPEELPADLVARRRFSSGFETARASVDAAEQRPRVVERDPPAQRVTTACVRRRAARRASHGGARAGDGERPSVLRRA